MFAISQALESFPSTVFTSALLHPTSNPMIDDHNKINLVIQDHP